MLNDPFSLTGKDKYFNPFKEKFCGVTVTLWNFSKQKGKWVNNPWFPNLDDFSNKDSLFTIW